MIDDDSVAHLEPLEADDHNCESWPTFVDGAVLRCEGCHAIVGHAVNDDDGAPE